jgi:hypothetical protein
MPTQRGARLTAVAEVAPSTMPHRPPQAGEDPDKYLRAPQAGAPATRHHTVDPPQAAMVRRGVSSDTETTHAKGR